MLNNIRKNYKYKTGIAAFAAMTMSLFASSCSNDEPLYSAEPGSISFTAPAQIGGSSSRVSYNQDENFLKVTWEPQKDIVLLYLDTDTTKAVATFEVTKVENNIATFTCKDTRGIPDITNVNGIMKYTPSSDWDPNSESGPYTQSANGSMVYKNQAAAATEHLKYANVIRAKLDKVNLTSKANIKFENTTAVFRINFSVSRNLSVGSSLTMYGVPQWGTGVSLTLGFPLNQNDELVAYIAAPEGQATGTLFVALTDGSTPNGDLNIVSTFSNTVTTYKGPSTKKYEKGHEYTATFDSTESWDAEIDGSNAFVDLGLSVFWSTKNLGAQALIGPESFGKYYAWGSIDGSYTKGFSAGEKPGDTTYGMDLTTLENKNVIKKVDGAYKLMPDYDAATSSKEGNSSWFTPTYVQWKELLEKCMWVWNAALNGYEVVSNKIVDGKKVTLFMPAAGFIEGNTKHNAGHYAYYWTSTPYGGTNDSWCMHISGPHRSYTEYWYPRYRGLSIRPVKWPEDDAPKTDQTTGK